VGDRHAGTLKREALSWALTGAVRYAVATALVAIVLAIALPDAGAERFATTAYIAAIFAAIVIGAQWLIFHRAGAGMVRSPTLNFPRALAFASGLTVLLVAASVLVGDPGAETALLVYCCAAVILAAVGRAGAFAWIHAKLSGGDRALATIRYGSIVAGVALLMDALLPGTISEFLCAIAYCAALVAGATLAWRLTAPTPLGAFLRQGWMESAETVAQLSAGRAFARLINASVVAIAASIVAASILRRPFSEPFAAVAYLGAVFAAVGVAMECWRRRAQPFEVVEAAVPSTRSALELPTRVAADVVAALTPETLIRYSAIAMLAAFVFAAPLWRRYGEPFAVIGYLSAVVLTVFLAIECRRALRKRSAKLQ
jgi:hypothetical protein